MQPHFVKFDVLFQNGSSLQLYRSILNQLAVLNQSVRNLKCFPQKWRAYSMETECLEFDGIYIKKSEIHLSKDSTSQNSEVTNMKRTKQSKIVYNAISYVTLCLNSHEIWFDRNIDL